MIINYLVYYTHRQPSYQFYQINHIESVLHFLLQVADIETRENLRAKILSESLSVRASERAARDITGPNRRTPTPEKPKAVPAGLDPDTRAYVEKIERHLQTKVSLRPNAEGGGKIEINYFNMEDLERLGAMLLGDS